jgi:bifunctional non-homologous end joining protein LigD
VLLPHLAGRALTRKRFPTASRGQVFFEKNAPRGTPEWVRTGDAADPGSSKGRETIDFVVVDDLATLVWTANLASLELHTHMWRVDRTSPTSSCSTSTPARRDDRRVLPRGRPAAPAAGGRRLVPYAKTSGSKGLQLYARADGLTSSEQTSAYAKGLAQRLEKEQPDLVVHRMTKALRDGKVLVDWSQNSAAKTTVSVYSLRARERPTVSTPVTWDEVEACADPADLVFTSDDVLARVERHGDLFAPLLAGSAA